jgi:ATP adenylyltransferase/5',5'''-P-1,P-4-tetraphosphate phosphorylase II
VASVGGALVGAVVLADSHQTAGDAELAAVAYAGSLLAKETTRLQNLGRRGRVRIAALIRSAALGLYA